MARTHKFHGTDFRKPIKFSEGKLKANLFVYKNKLRNGTKQPVLNYDKILQMHCSFRLQIKNVCHDLDISSNEALLNMTYLVMNNYLFEWND